MFEVLSTYNVPGDLWEIVNFAPNRVWIYSYPDPPDESYVISAFLAGDIDLKGNSAWSNAIGAGSGDIMGAINKAVDQGSEMVNTVLSLIGQQQYGIPKIQVRSPKHTAVDWQGSGEFKLILSLIFPALTPDEDVRVPIKHLMTGVYPIIAGKGAFILPPRGYAKIPDYALFSDDGSSRGTKGCVGIEIGNWFSTPPLFVIEDVTFNLSRELTPAGLPLYATAIVSVKSSIQVGINHIEEWMGVQDGLGVV